MKWYEKASRYFLGVWFLICAVDGWAFLFFDIHLTGDLSVYRLLASLVSTTYFWAFLKVVQTLGAVSLLLNYKPALGLALTIPVSSVLCLFYLFELWPFMLFGMLIIASTVILCRAYSESYMPMLKKYT